MPRATSSSAASVVASRGRSCLPSKRPEQASLRSASKRARTRGSSRPKAVSLPSIEAHSKSSLSPTSSPNPKLSGILDDGRKQHQAAWSSDVETNEVIMALAVREKTTMGCAFFHTEEGVIYLSQEITAATIDIAEQFITHVQPTTIIVSARAPEDLVRFLERKSKEHGYWEDATALILKVVSSSQFDASSARDSLINLCLKGVDNVHDQPAAANLYSGVNFQDTHQHSYYLKSLRCGSRISLDDISSVSCAGAIIAELQRRRLVGMLPNGQSAEFVFHIKDLQLFSLEKHMYICADSLVSLQIVQSELHPNNQAAGSGSHLNGSKESLSVYGLFHHLANSPQGRAALRRFFLRPSLDIDIIAERQHTITLLLRPEYRDLIDQASAVLHGVKNIPSLIIQLRKGINSPSSGHSFDRSIWASLRGFAAQASKLRGIMNGIPRNCNTRTVSQLQEQIHLGELISVGDMIDRIIDFEQSKARHRPSVKSGIDSNLDNLKNQYDGMASLLIEVVKEVNRTLPEWAHQYIQACIFLPQLGFLIMVEPDENGQSRYEGEGAENDHWERHFATDEAVYYKNRHMNDLDNLYGDISGQIGDREVEIIHSLAKSVLEHENALMSASDICGEFDALLALAQGAQKYGWNRPQLVSENIIHIKGGRHPLQELVVPSFIPNDCCIPRDGNTSEKGKALILTGPNQSGKSVYLKQVAIIVYLTHIGSFVPAETAKIGLTDKILTRISTKESVSLNESAFAIDLRQVAQSVRTATSRSLVLVDEFGKGTNGDDGAGLLAGLVDHFLLSTVSPRLLLATHFNELIEGGYLQENDSVTFAHMSVRVDSAACQTENDITYLFQLMEGYSNSSLGSKCAALNGVPSAIVDRSEAITRLLARNEDIISACAKLNDDEELALSRAENVARQFLESVLGPNFRAAEAKLLLYQILGTCER